MANTTEARKIAAAKAAYSEINLHLGISGLAGSVADWTPEQVAERIRELADVIRSGKWRDAVESYARFVLANSEGKNGPADHLTWAVGQGSVYFSSAAF